MRAAISAFSEGTATNPVSLPVVSVLVQVKVLENNKNLMGAVKTNIVFVSFRKTFKSYLERKFFQY